MVVEDIGRDEIVQLECKEWEVRRPEWGLWKGEQQYVRTVGESILKEDWEGMDEEARELEESNEHRLLENERKRR